MKNIDARNHVQGKSIYLDDIPEINGTLYAVPFDAPVGHARIVKMDFTKAMNMPGIARIITAADIPGENQIGGIIPDEPLFAEGEIHFWGHPIGVILGTSEYACRKAREVIEIEYEALPVITCPREAQKQNHLIAPPRTFVLGDTSEHWADCDYVLEGKADVNGQEHLYIETQGAYARPKEDGCIWVASSTQGPTAVQKAIRKVLNLPMHKIEVDTVRLGGGFGGKEDQATAWAVMAALAAHVVQKPVKLSLHRMDDMRMTGKRHPYSADYKIGLNKDLKILCYEATFYQNAGAAADLSTSVLERTLFHCTNAYFIPNVKATAYSCKTNLPPNTAFRGFGGPQGMFVIEAAITKVAEQIGVTADQIQKANLVRNGDVFSYGQVIDKSEAHNSWNACVNTYNLEKIQAEIRAFNQSNYRFKKGVAVQPICFGISFTNTMMNHARALVHIYQDGSMVVSTGAVEMGQGVNTKLAQVAAITLGIPASWIRLESTNTLRVANTSPTAASAGADLNGKALQIACQNLMDRMMPVAQALLNTEANLQIKDGVVHKDNEATELTWQQLVLQSFMRRISLSEQAHYSTPVIQYDKTKEKGHPFAYHVYGTAILVVTVDCLRGTYVFDEVNIVHDLGKTLNADIDNGQIEGALVQGIGWMTLEEILFNDKGKLLTHALSTYKIPDIYSVPLQINIQHLDTPGHDLAILKSKAVGEPPLMYGLGAYFAIRNAVKAFNPNHDPNIDAPYTPEKVLMDLYSKRKA